MRDSSFAMALNNSLNIHKFNFMLVGSEKNNVIPYLSFNKDVSEIQYKPFVDYK